MSSVSLAPRRRSQAVAFDIIGTFGTWLHEFSVLTIGHFNNSHSTAGVPAGDTQASPSPSKGMSYHFRIGRAFSSVSLTNSALPQYSRVPWFRGVKLKSWQERLTMFDGLGLSSSGWYNFAPSNASSKPRFLLRTSSTICLPLGIRARTQRRQFRAYARNIMNIERLRPACSLSRAGSSLVVRLLFFRWRRRKIHRTVVWSTNRLNLSRLDKLNDKKIIQKIRKTLALWSAALTIRSPVRFGRAENPECLVVISANSMWRTFQNVTSQYIY